MKRNILIMGTGSIGRPLIKLFLENKNKMSIGKIYFYKHSPTPRDQNKIKKLQNLGAILCVEKKKILEFKNQGYSPNITFDKALEDSNVICDCSPKRSGMENKEKIYKHTSGKKRYIGSGSEFGFGMIYVWGVNDLALNPNLEYIQVASCNTHSISAILNAAPQNSIEYSRFTCNRRAADIDQKGKFVQAPVLEPFKNEKFGTHHARDAYEVFKTLEKDLNVFSTARIINTSLMHFIDFELVLRPETLTTKETFLRAIKNDPRIVTTSNGEMNYLFAYGREYGFCGRILNTAIFYEPSLNVYKNHQNHIYGTIFTSQDGNALLSYLSATLNFFDPENYLDIMTTISQKYLIDEI